MKIARNSFITSLYVEKKKSLFEDHETTVVTIYCTQGKKKNTHSGVHPRTTTFGN